MNKFTIAEITGKEIKDDTKPVLYKINIGTKYYLHKGKKIHDSLNRFLDDVFRGLRGKQCPAEYSNIVDYCKRYPSLHKVMPEVVSNDVPAKILALEDKMYKQMANDESCLNRLDIAPYKPEWMLKDAMQKRCEDCIKEGSVNDKKLKFKFCPNCGRLNK